MDTRQAISVDQELSPERIAELTTQAHRMRNEYIALSARRLVRGLRRGLAALAGAPARGLAGSH